MAIFDEIREGLEEAIAYEKGALKAEKVTLSIVPPERFDSAEIRNIRSSTGLTQKLFAKFMGVSVKTVEAWEAGRNHPEGAACRLLTLTKNNPDFPRESGIVKS